MTGDATYTATYTESPIPTPAQMATLTFDLAGGTLDGKTGTITIEANVGDTIRLPGAPTRDGYTFKYWKGSEYEAGAEYKVEDDHAFTAEWEKNEPTPAKPSDAVNGTSSNASSGTTKSGSSNASTGMSSVTAARPTPRTGDESVNAVVALLMAGTCALFLAHLSIVRRRTQADHS